MTLNSSGPISLAGTTAGVSIEIENGGNGTTMISLNDTAVRTLAGVPSGAIIMPTNFYGKSNSFNFSITSNTSNANLRSLAITAGWGASSKVVATINSGIYVYSNVTSTPGLTINGSFPAGVTLVNNGFIVGMGGAGGNGGSGSGSNAGLATLISVAVTINNTSGTIAGGGGGGGGGTSCYSGCPCFGFGAYGGAGGGGGGGRTGLTNSSGGAPDATPGNSGYHNQQPGAAGTSTAAGSGGSPAQAYGGETGTTGGSGGNWGANGANGANNFTCSGGPGGTGGNATSGAGTYVTWAGTGTRYGTVG